MKFNVKHLFTLMPVMKEIVTLLFDPSGKTPVPLGSLTEIVEMKNTDGSNNGWIVVMKTKYATKEEAEIAKNLDSKFSDLAESMKKA